MASRRKISFELLRYESSGDEEIGHIKEIDDFNPEIPTPATNGDRPAANGSRRRRHKTHKKKKSHATLDNAQIYSKDNGAESVPNLNLRKCATVDMGCLAEIVLEESLSGGDIDNNNNNNNNNNSYEPIANGVTDSDRVDFAESEDRDLAFPHRSSNTGLLEVPELRQRNVNVTTRVVEERVIETVEMQMEREREREDRISGGSATPIVLEKQQEQVEKKEGPTLTSQALDLGRVMAETCEHPSNVDMSPFGYFWGEISGGNSLRSTTSVGNEKKRQRVYNTMFHVPWRCELLIDVGFFVCLDSFLSLLTIMPARILVFFWRCLNIRQFQRPLADELSDFGCLVVLVCGVALLQVTDISLIYHFIRGQGTIKLYVVFNVLEIFDKLCQSFGGDVLQVLFNSAVGVASASNEHMAFETMRFIVDQVIAVAAFIVHSFIILAQAITLSAAIISHNNALMALLVSNNFAEIKSNVFKRVSEENLHKMSYYDTVERFHIMAYIIFVLAQNILEAESPWFWSFAMNAFLIWTCEVLVDVIKHAFLAKFNEIRPYAYSEFLESLCKQTLNSQSHELHKTLTFVPLAPACVVIRVLIPIYAACLPSGPVWWRWFWVALVFSSTYLMLASFKIMVGLGLQTHARWYIRRCLHKKRHLHVD